MGTDKIDQLYDDLKSLGIVSKDRENFRKKMLAPGREGFENRYFIWKTLHDNGLSSHDSYDSFAKNGLGLHPKSQPTAKAAPARKATGTATDQWKMPANFVENAMQSPQYNPGANNPRNTYGTRKKMQPQQPKIHAPGSETDKEKKREERVMRLRRDQLDYIQATGKPLENPIELGVQHDKNGNVVTAPLWAPSLERDGNGNVVSGENGEPLIGMDTENDAREAYRITSQAEVEADRSRRAEDKAVQDALDLNKAIEDRDRLEKQMSATPITSEDYWMLRTARNAAEDRIREIQAVKDDRDGSFLGGLWRGFRDAAFDVSNWNFGITDTYEAAMKERARVNDLLGEGTAASREVARQAYAADQAAARKDAEVGNGYQWGSIAGYSAPYMADFLIGSKLGITTKLARGGRALGVAAARKIAMKDGGSIVRNLERAVVKNTGIVLGDVASAGALATTVQGGKTGADILSRYTGSAVFDPTDGTYHFEGGETIGKAIYKGLSNAMVENYTEMLGAHMRLGKWANQALNKMGLKRVSDMIAGMTRTDAYRTVSKWMEMSGYNGLPGEIMEEEAGIPLHAIFDGSNEFRDLIDPKQQMDIIGGMTFSMAVTGGAMAGAYGASKGANTAMYYRDRHKLNSLDRVAAYRMTEDVWAPIKDRLDNASNEDIQDVFTHEVLDNAKLSRQEKEAAWKYANRLIMLRGHNIGMQMGEEHRRQDGKGSSASQDEAYRTGYNAADGAHNGVQDGETAATPSEHDIKVAYEQARDGVAGMYGEDFVRQLDEDPDAALARLEDESRGRQKAQAYVDAKAMYDGMMQRARDDMDDRVQTVENEVDSHVNPVDQGGDGMIHPATLKEKNDDGTDRKVYIVSGNVQMTADGTMVDKEKSSPSIVVRDPQTGETKMMSPADILSVDEPIDPEQERREAADAARQEFAAQRADRIDGLAPMSNPQQNDDVWVKNENGEPVHGVVTQVDPVTGEYFVQTDTAVNGKMAQPFQAGQLYELATPAGAAAKEQPAEQTDGSLEEEQPTRKFDGVNGAYRVNGAQTQEEAPQEQQTQEEAPQEEQTQEKAPQEEPQRAIDRIPSEDVDDGKGNVRTVHNWEQAEPGETYDALAEIYHGNADRVKKGVQNRINAIDKQMKATQKQMDAIDNSDDFDAVAAQGEKYDQLQQQMAALEQQKKYWQGVQNVPASRRAVQDRRTEAEKAAAKAEREKAEQEAIERARQERERVNGVPDVANDAPSDARKRGFRNVYGTVVNRQGNTEGVTGRESSVKFSSKDTAKGKVKVIEADSLQPSHVNGQRNPQFFIDEAQPKDRTDTVSSMAAAKIASSLNPEEITGDGSAYQFSAPTVNSRGEVIQGNNRSDALKLMYSTPAFKPAQDAYKQYIIDHASDFGFTPEDVERIKQMKRPVMVNELDVDDDEAIRLGQMKASDNESGGIERIDPVTTSQKLGSKVRNYANILLSSPDEDASLSDVLMQNGSKTVHWLSSNGVISDTAAQSAFDRKGNLTPEARMDLLNVLKQSLFQGGVSDLRTMFGRMPAKAQKAILNTFMRDFDSAESERVLPEIQKSIEAWYGCANASEAFAKAPNYKAAKAAMHDWTLQTNMLDDNMPSDRFSNFAMELACRLQGCSMRETQQSLNDFFDLVQGKSQGDLFGGTTMGEQADRQEAIRRVFDIDYKPIKNKENGKKGSDAVADDNSQSGEGRPGSTGDGAGRERAAGAGQHADVAGGTEGNDEGTQQTGVRLNKEEAERLLSNMESQAEASEEVELTPEAWSKTFDENNSTDTPIGRVKMGEGQITKFFAKGREKEFGMVGPTLNNPDVIIEEKSEAKNGKAERKSSYVFVKTFNRNGEKIKFYASITVKQDGMEVSVSSHYMNRNAVLSKMQEGNVFYIRKALLPISSDWHLAEHQDGVPDLLPTQGSTASSAKLGNSSESGDKKSEKVAETHEENGDKRIVSDKDFNVDDIDFEHNYVVIHQTMSRVFDSILRDGLHTAGGLIGTSVFGNRENIEDTLKAEREGHGHKGSNGLVIMQFPKSWFNGRRIDLDDISMELSDRFGPDAFLTVPPQFITHAVVAGKMEEDGASDKASSHLVDPRKMSDEEKEQRGKMLSSAKAIPVTAGQIKTTSEKSARKEAEKWWQDHFAEPVDFNTEIGEVRINLSSIKDSLAHGYSQPKLDAITSLAEGFPNAVYLGSMKDFIRDGNVMNHYFAYPIIYNGKRCYVFCRAMQDANTNRLYVHEVFVGNEIKKGNTLQTAASQPHGGIALYRDILSNVLSAAKVENSSESSDKKSEKVGEGSNNSVKEDTAQHRPTERSNDSGHSIGATDTPGKVVAERQNVNTDPTEGQKEAGNYKKGHIKVDGYDITIENPKGSTRSGKDASGKAWSVPMHYDYGYIKGTEGVDGDHIDVYLSDEPTKGNVYVVDQINQNDGSFDEHKVMYGFPSMEAAVEAYKGQYTDGWKVGTITEVSREDFKKWVESSKRKTKPFADYKSMEAAAQQQRTKPGGKQKAEEKPKAKRTPDTKIEDVGEHLKGARKDMLREIAKSLANVTEAALIEKPFGKVYKKPDLKKAVESGALREKDAFFYEALFSMVNQQKPKVTQSEMRSKRYIPDYKTKAERWAADTFKQMEVLRQFMELDEPGRDAMMERMLADRYPTREQELAEIEKRKGWNPDYEGHKYEWGDKTTPNPLWVTHEVMNRMGYNVGDKLDIPFGVVEANTSGTGYSIKNLKGERAWLFGSDMTLDEAIDRIVYLAKLKRGDADVSHPTQLFAFPATKSEMGESGRYRVMWGRDYKTRDFGSKEEADAFAQTKSGAYVSPIMETKRRFGYKVRFTHPLTGEKMFVDDAEFDTKEEAQAYFDSNFEKINDATNAKLQEEREKKGEKKTLTADEVVHATMVRSSSGKWVYAVVIDKKYANNDGQVRIIKEGFASRKDAKAFADSVKDDVLKTVLKHKEEAKKIVYFDTGENSRIGEDYRNGKDVDAEDFMNTFGFRGVQFGNWTNQEDRQMALNQAYDALMDLANVIGVSPQAISLNGELGIAFGSRGSGNANAHYEPNNVVINLTKTRGAGSLAHEWWHALDNYFARRVGRPLGMVTDNREIAMRAELREAFNNMLDLVEKSDYARRSRARGEYWGSMHEITARLLSEWIDNELKKRSELNTFLTRGANVERWQRYNYKAFEAIERIAGREPISFEEFKERPESLSGFPYPSTKEVEQFGASLRHIFDTIEESVDEKTGMHALLSKVRGEAKPVSEDEAALRDAVMDLEREAGLDVIDDVEEGQRVLDMANDALLDKNKKRALETVSPILNGTDHQTVIPSADGAKVLNNLDTLVKEYENSSYTKEKTFIGEVAVALGIPREKFKDKSSQYATFETKNGKIVTIRISNHNATASNLDVNGQEDAISIVVSNKPNTGITNDGDAHIVEYYYNAIKLRRAEGKPLADIVRSIKQALYSGEFKDTTGLAERQEVNIPAKFRKMMNKVRFFRTADGYAYGYTVDGKIYIDPRIATSETPIHEYAHLWAEALRKANPKEWQNVVDLMKECKAVWAQVRREYPELKTDDEIADEVLAHYSGRRGAERLRTEATKAADAAKGVLDKAAVVSGFGRLREAIKKAWKHIAEDILHIHFTSADEVADKVMYDLLNKVKPGDVNRADVSHGREDVDAVNKRFNEELDAYVNQQMPKNDMLHLGMPLGVLGHFLPNLPIVMRQRILTKASVKKHNVDLLALRDMPKMMSHPIFIFQRADNAIGILTEMKDRDGKNVCVAIDLARTIQDGGEMLEVNDIRSIHGREISDIVYPILKNETLRWVDKAKGLAYLSSASRYVQQEIDKQDLSSAAKIVEDFENPVIKDENLSGDEENNSMKGAPTTPAEAEEGDVLYREVDDEEQKRLDKEPTVKVYRAMQEHDGKLYPPMSGRVRELYTTKNGSVRNRWVWRAPIELGKWEQSEEHPEMANEDGTFTLDKGNGSTINAAYNPYIHTSRTPINDQFSSAWNRPELVTVEVEVPLSELSSGYKAEKAKDATGEVEWKSGPVGREMAAQGKPRMVILSRWDKPVRIVPVEEVADEYAKRLQGTGISVPFNTVPPALREALVARGVEISEPEKGNAGQASRPSYEEWMHGRTREREGNGAYSDDELSMINDPFVKMLGEKARTAKQRKAFAARERRRMEAAAHEWADKLHLDNVEIVTSNDRSTRRGRAKGYYDKATGKIVVNINNHQDVQDVIQTILHEAVGHYGLRQLFGQHFNTFLENVYAAADMDVRRRITELALRKYGGNFHVATEEYLASLAEDTNYESLSKGFWPRIKQLFLRMLRAIGLEGFADRGVTLSDNELRYILWRSYKNLTAPGEYRSFADEAEDVAKQAELEVGDFRLDKAIDQGASPEELAVINETVQRSWLAKKAMDTIRQLTAAKRELDEAITENPSSEKASRLRGQLEKLNETMDDNRDWAEDLNVDLRQLLKDNGVKEEDLREYDSWQEGYAAAQQRPTEESLNEQQEAAEGGSVAEALSVRAEEIRNMPAIPIKKHDTSREYVREQYNKLGSATNKRDGKKVTFYHGVFGKMWRGENSLFAKIAPQLKEVFKESIYGFSSKDALSGTKRPDGTIHKEHRNISKYDYYVGKVDIDGKNYYVRFTIENENTQGAGVHHVMVTDVSIYENPTGDASTPTMRGGRLVSNGIISDAKLMHLFGFDVNNSEKDADASENASEPEAWGKRDLLSKAEQISNGMDPELLFRDSIEDDDDTARETYNRMADRARETFREAWQDSMINVRRLQESVLKQRGEKLEDWEDAYNEENRSHGHAQDLDEYFDRTLYKPLLKAVNAVAKAAKVSVGDVTEYMMAKHGLERNEVFARRDAQAAWEKYKERKQGEYYEYQTTHPNGNKTLDDFMDKSYDDFYNHYREKDYSGLTSLTGTDNVQDAEAEAQRIVADMEGRNGIAPYTTKLWKATNEATGWTLQKAYESGVISKDNYEQVSRMFDYYIPLRGWKEDTAGDLYDYVGSGDKGTAFSPTLHKAKGRRSQADNPIAYISSMAVSAIEQGRKNLVKQSFMWFVKNHPTNLVTVSEMWYRNYGTDTAPDWREDVPDIPEDATADEIADIVKQHEDDMKQLEAQGMATKERGRLHLGVPVNAGQAKEHHVEVMVNGKKYVLYINGNPRAAQALNGTRARRASEHGVTQTISGIADNFSNMKNLFGKTMAWVLRRLATMQRAMGAFFTSKNPAFMLGNALRDVDMALASTIIDEPIKYAHLFRMNMLRLGGPIGMIRLMHWYNKEGAGMEFTDMKNMKTMQRYFYEFVKGGGRTGFTSLRDIDDYKIELAAKFKDLKRLKVSPVLLFKDLGDCFEYCNRAVEDMTRFATFVAARQYGKSVRESVSDAKNITLNFNRKGSGEMGNVQVRDLIIFVNPAIQALDRIVSMARRHPVKFSAYTAYRVLAGMGTPYITMLLWNAFGGDGGDDDDKWNAVDEYWKLPTWTRRNNLVFWIPTTKKFAMIPLSQELRVANGFGEALTSELTGHSNESTMLTLASGLAGLLPIDFEGNGGNPLITLAPTATQPLLQVGFNTDFTGRPIYKDNDFNKYEPSFQKAYIGTPKELISLSAKINELTGGDDHKQGWWERTKVGGELNNPAVVNHLLKGYFGGMYSILAQTGGLLWKAYLGETPDVQEVPIANRVVTAVRETQQNGKTKLPDWYYDLADDSKRYQSEVSGYRRDMLSGKQGARQQFDAMTKTQEFVKQEQIKTLMNTINQIRAAQPTVEDPQTEEEAQTKQELADGLQTCLRLLEKIRQKDRALTEKEMGE